MPREDDCASEEQILAALRAIEQAYPGVECDQHQHGYRKGPGRMPHPFVDGDDEHKCGERCKQHQLGMADG